MMPTQAQEALLTNLNQTFSLLTLIGFVVMVVWALVALLYYVGVLPKARLLLARGSRHVFLLGLLVSLSATVGSLYYSYGLGVAACDLCWLQRIFIYPLVILFAMGWYKKDTNIFDYILALSGIGFLIALYHHYLQIGYNLLAPCSTAPFAVDCATPTFIEYGFITFPMMGVVTCGIVFLSTLSAKLTRQA